MANYSAQKTTHAGVTSNMVAVSSTDTFANDGRTILEVKNASASSVTVTIVSQQQCNHGFTHNITVAVAAGATSLIGPFNPTRFNDPVTGLVTVQYSATASVTAGLYSVPS